MLCCCEIIQKEEIKYKMVINLKCSRWLSDFAKPDNVYIIIPVQGGKERTVNCRELKDLDDIAVENETNDEDDGSDVCKELGVPRNTPPVVQ